MMQLLTSELERYFNKIQLKKKPLNLNYRWRKDGPDASQILYHTLEAVNYWVGELMLNIPSHRDRENEFNTHHSLGEIKLALDKSFAYCYQLANKEIKLDQPIEVSADNNPDKKTEWTVLTGLIHITAHTAEHVGQLKCL